MAPRLRIFSNLIERLKNLDGNVTGNLYGIMYDNTLTLLTFTINENSDEPIFNPTSLQLSMPAEVYLYGVLHVGDQNEELPDIFQDIDVTDNPLLLKYSLNDASVKPYFYVHQKLEPVENIQIVKEDKISSEFAYIRLQGSLPLTAQHNNISELLEELRKNVASGGIGIHFPHSNMYLFDMNDNLKEMLFSEIVGTSGNYEGPGRTKKDVTHNPGTVNAVHANMLLKMNIDNLSEERIQHTPILQHVKRPFNGLKGRINIDALSLVNLDTNLSELHGILVESICRNIKLMEQCFEMESQNIEESITLPNIYHFKPQICGHLITVAYPGNSADNETVAYRKFLHKTLGLNLTKPQFRYGNTVKFSDSIDKSGIIINPHEAISQTEDVGRNDKKTVTVQGLYAYHHYMQNNFNDDGWGCAYRSLQTIISWFRLQGYTNKAIPSHHEIQECLVEIGDKPSSFIGSKQWIGSTEVGFVLETLLGINIKILRASTGEEVATLGPDLVHHFETQGTPIMIGGGVLAHTILGVSYDSTTEDVKFLILDPHYTGPENLTTIINKGWCGWKTKTFWKKDAFYNMCLPQRPLCI